MTPRSIACLLLLAALLGAVVFAPSFGDNSLWAATLHNLAHGPVFGCVALISLIGLRGFSWFETQKRTHQYVIAFAIAVVLGAASELAQVATGRDASWFDVGNDVLGAIAFLSIFAAFDTVSGGVQTRGRRGLTFFFGAVALLVLASPLAWTAYAYASRAKAFPQIANFSEGIGFGFLHARLSVIDITPVPEEWARFSEERALRIHFLPGPWPGIEFRETPPNWRGYRALLLDVTNPRDSTLTFIVRIDDRRHDGRYADRFNRRFEVPGATRSTIRIPLSDIESAPRDRKFDLANVARLLLFQPKGTEPGVMYVSRVWLE